MAPEGFMLPGEAAKELGTTTRTLRRLRASGAFVPHHSMQAGGLQVNLYSDDDLVVLRGILRGR